MTASASSKQNRAMMAKPPQILITPDGARRADEDWQYIEAAKKRLFSPLELIAYNEQIDLWIRKQAAAHERKRRAKEREKEARH